MTTKEKFLQLVSQARPFVRSAKLLDHVIEGHHLVGFDDIPGAFLVVSGDSTAQQLAVALAIRETERQAAEAFYRAQQLVKAGAMHPASESVQWPPKTFWTSLKVSDSGQLTNGLHGVQHTMTEARVFQYERQPKA
jgi:hypothetical protein